MAAQLSSWPIRIYFPNPDSNLTTAYRAILNLKWSSNRFVELYLEFVIAR